MATARKYDDNGWFEVQDNPISKPGVFDYLGRSIGAPEADKIYKVWRPESELNNKDTIESFKLVPWVDDHTMLGGGQGMTPAEQKGVHGVIGEKVYFKDGYLRGNLKVFSESQSDIINSGKRELSLGFRCMYDFTPGVTPDGKSYDVVQRKIRGNHVASVDEGRMGPEVAVMDCVEKFTFDSKDLIMDQKDKKPGTGFDESQKSELAQMIADAVVPAVNAAMDAKMEEMKDGMYNKDKAKDEEEEKDKKSGMDEEKDKKDMGKDEEKDKEKMGMDAIEAAISKAVSPLVAKVTELEGKAMDTKEVIADINARDALVTKLSPFIGAFDHKDKTLSEVQKYGVEKLGLDAAEGQEGAVLAGYLHGRQPTQSYAVVNSGMDGAEQGDIIGNYAQGE